MTTKRGAKKCDNCLRGASLRTTGVNPKDATLKIDIGGAVLYVMPGSDGEINVTLNTQNLIDGDYALAIWNGDTWIIQKGGK